MQAETGGGGLVCIQRRWLQVAGRGFGRRFGL